MKMSEVAFVLKYTISVWGAQETDRGTSHEILQSKHANDKAGKFIKNLLGGDVRELKDIQKFAASFRLRIKNMTVPLSHGSSLFPIVQTKKVCSFVKTSISEFNELVSALELAYPEIIERAKEQSQDLYEEGQCPPWGIVRRKFEFTYMVEPLPQSNGFDQQYALDDSEELKQDFEKKMEGIFEKGEASLKGRLINKAQGTRRMLALYEGKSGQLSKRSFNSTTEEIKLIRELNMRDNGDINLWANKLQIIVEVPAADYRQNEDLRSTTVDSLDIMLREMGAESIVELTLV